MRFEPTALPGVVVVEPDVHRDARGYFLETWQAEKYAAGGIPGPFVQDNHAFSWRGTLRGLHVQARQPQGKLVRVVVGEVFDVAVDVRRGSPHFGRWIGVRLSAENCRQMWVPPGFAHGLCVLSEQAHVEYKCTTFYDPTDELAIVWNDAHLGIEWPLAAPTVSARDAAGSRLAEVLERLPVLGQGC